MKTLRLGHPRTALVLAPHPDDEAIGAYGLIATLRRLGCRVGVIVVSDGAGSHRNSRLWPAARLVAERRRETRRAMRRLGVAAGRITFLGLPDGHVEDGAGTARIARRVRLAGTTDLLVIPAGDDAHPDHRHVAAAAGRVRLPGTRRLSYRVWTGGNRPRGYAWPLPLGARQAPKRAAIRRYRTQFGLIRDDPAGFAIAPHELRAFTRPAEFYREVAPCGRSR